MKKIDYIYKNFDVIAFSKNLKKIKKSECSELSDFLTSIVLESTRDISQIKKEINYHQFTKSKPDSEITERWGNYYTLFSKNCVNFLKKFGNNYSEKDIVKYFFEQKNLLNMDFSNSYEEWKNLFGIHVNTGEFFRKFKKHFKIIYYGHLSYMAEDRHRDSPYEDIFCLHVPQNKKFYLFFYGYEEDGNDSSGVAKIYNKKPTKDQIEKDIKTSNIFRYADLAEKYNWRKIIQSSGIIKFDKEYNRIYSDGFKFEHKEEPCFSNESDYFNFHNSKGELAIARSMAILNPEKYFKKHFKDWKQVADTLGASKGGYHATKRKAKIETNKFFKFVMSEKLNYRNNIKFIEEIIYSYDDLEGFLKHVPLKTQESKELKEEIRILRMFRSNNKKFIIEVFNKNEDKLETLAKNYMPTTIFDDPKLMFELIKLDPNFSADIGEKLKKNKEFMSKVNKHLDNL